MWESGAQTAGVMWGVTCLHCVAVVLQELYVIERGFTVPPVEFSLLLFPQ
jgi:hypothetical protein